MKRKTSQGGCTQAPLLILIFVDERNTSPITSGPTAHHSRGRPRFKCAGGEDTVCSKREDSGCSVVPFYICVTVWVARAPRPLGRYLLKTTMASINSPTDEDPLQPGIRSIVTLAMAHTQKVYFSGTPVRYNAPEVHNNRRLWVQLTGSSISVGQQGEKVSLPSVNVANGVRLLFHLRYLCDSAKPSSLVHHSLQTH